jgi:hypothetical protein
MHKRNRHFLGELSGEINLIFLLPEIKNIHRVFYALVDIKKQVLEFGRFGKMTSPDKIWPK